MALTEKQISDFFIALDDIVGSEGPWTEKVEALWGACVGTDEANLHEFITWFEEKDTTP